MATDVQTQVKLGKLVAGASSPDVTNGKDKGTKLSNPNSSYFNKSIQQLRQSGNELEAIRTLARTHGDVSATISAMVRLANTPLKFRVYDDQHQLSEDGSQLLRSILARFDYQFDYTTGFDSRLSMAELVESLLRSVPLTGAVAAELVLDKARLPFSIKPIPVDKITWVTSSKKDGINSSLVPRMKTTNGDVDLDIPSIFYAALDSDPHSAYSFSPMEPAINTSVFYSEVVEDIRKVAIQTAHSRLLLQLELEKLLASAPLDVKADNEKLAAWIEGQRASVQQEVEGLKPESALVTYDSVNISYLNSEIGGSSSYAELMQTLDAILATSLKCPSSILGKPGAGSQNTASVESLLFLKQAASLQPPVATLLSKALTLACRLVGFAGYVKVEFSEISLRPEVENEAFMAMRQARILEQLSLGFVSDAEAAELLGSGALSPEFQPLSGTGFYNAKQGGDAPNPNDSPATRAPNPTKEKAPKSGGGKDNSTRK